MVNWLRIPISIYLSVNILLAQTGIHIFEIYCNCNHNWTVSLYSDHDSCAKEKRCTEEQSCCSKNQHSTHQENKKCTTAIGKYLKADIKGTSLSFEKISNLQALLPSPWTFSFDLDTDIREAIKIILPENTSAPPLSGKLYCILFQIFRL